MTAHSYLFRNFDSFRFLDFHFGFNLSRRLFGRFHVGIGTVGRTFRLFLQQTNNWWQVRPFLQFKQEIQGFLQNDNREIRTGNMWNETGIKLPTKIENKTPKTILNFQKWQPTWCWATTLTGALIETTDFFVLLSPESDDESLLDDSFCRKFFDVKIYWSKITKDIHNNTYGSKTVTFLKKKRLHNFNNLLPS